MPYFETKKAIMILTDDDGRSIETNSRCKRVVLSFKISLIGLKTRATFATNQISNQTK